MKRTRRDILTVAVTGGIASGKTLVCQLFQKRGARVIDADAIGRDIVENRQSVLDALVRAFGHRILNTDGRLDRRALARLVFSGPDYLNRLNDIVHPYLIPEIKNRLSKLTREGFSGIVVADAALIFEWNLVETFDFVVVVSCDEQTQLGRMRERDALEADEALLRVRSQIPQAEKVARADFHIPNNGSLGELEEKADAVWVQLNQLLEAKRKGEI